MKQKISNITLRYETKHNTPMASILLTNVPQEIKSYILKIQGEIKAKKGTQFSQESTIVQILREHKEYSESKKLKKTDE